MHVGDNHDRGGNDTQVRFFERGTNMHGLWDGGIIARISTSEDYWLKELTVLATPQSRDAAAEGTVEDWATESLLAAREAYQDPTTKQRIKPGAKLGQAYLDKSWACKSFCVNAGGNDFCVRQFRARGGSRSSKMIAK